MSQTPSKRAAPSREFPSWLSPRVTAGIVALFVAGACGWTLYQQRRRSPRARELEVTDATRRLFQQYEQFRLRSEPPSSWSAPPPVVSDELITARVEEVCRTAVAVHSYRCIEERRFAEPRIALHPLYPAIVGQQAASDSSIPSLPAALSALPVSQRRLLDIGCCFGTDLRALIVAGFQPQHLLGVDIESTFIALGLDHLFQDRTLLASRFSTGDILAPACEDGWPALREFLAAGPLHFAYAGSVYHLLSEADTLRLSRALFRVLAPGGVAFGRTVGLVDEAREVNRAASQTSAARRAAAQLRFLHTAASLQAHLENVGFTNVRVQLTRVDMPDGSRSGRERKWGSTDAATTLLAFSAVKPAQRPAL